MKIKKPTIDEYLPYYEYIKKHCKAGEYNLLLHRHLGDSFVIMGMYDDFIKKYKKPLHLLIPPNQEILAWMYNITNYTVVDIKELLANENLNIQYSRSAVDKFAEDMFEKLFPAVPQLDSPFIAAPSSWIKENLGWKNFVNGWSKMLGLDCEKIIPPTRCPDMTEKFKKELALIAPIDKIVLVAPEAQSFSSVPIEFWEKLVKKLHSQGMEIVVNTIDKDFVLEGTHNLDMSVSDLIALGLKCNSVYSLRSGLCDCLVNSQSNLHVYYTPEMWYKYLSLNECFYLDSPVNEYVISNLEKITRNTLSKLRNNFIQTLQKKKRKKTIINPPRACEISSSDITVVVQGAISTDITSKCLSSIRRQLPNCEIILSTWQGANITGLDYDKIVLNQDPGAEYFDSAGKIYNNCNRQLVSTQAGLSIATRKYILKFRTDFILESTDFLRYWNEFSLRNREFAFFKHRVLVDTIFSRFASDATGYLMPFHVSDFWMFGYAEDVRDYFANIKLVPKTELGEYNHLYSHRKPYPQMSFKYAPEQYYCYSFVKKHIPDLQFKDWSDWSCENMDISNKVLYNNFIFLSYEQSGIWSDKHAPAILNPNNVYGIINFYYYQEQYKKYCDSTYKCRKVYTTDNSHLYYFLHSFIKKTFHISRFVVVFTLKICTICKEIYGLILKLLIHKPLRKQIILKINN